MRSIGVLRDGGHWPPMPPSPTSAFAEGYGGHEGRREKTLGRREERQWCAIGWLEHHLHLLADLQLFQIAVDDVGLQRRAFLQRDVSNRVRTGRRFAHQAVGVDRGFTRTLLPHRLVGEAEWADRAREVVRLAAGGAALDHELAGLG